MVQNFVKNLQTKFKSVLPGFAVAVVIALAAQFLSEHYGAPALLMALLLGLAFHFLSEDERSCIGINFSAKTVLRFGVALLGARISVDLLMGLGPAIIGLVIAGVILTVIIGLLIGRLCGAEWRFALLTSGAVAICGASAAMAIAAVLPTDKHSERNLLFTVLSVTVLSTIAMIFYPIGVQLLDLSPNAMGVFLGGTIHDVAQVVGAGFSISDETGQVATLVKLMRVAMLAPMVLAFSLIIRATGNVDRKGERPALLPGFVIGFLILGATNSFGFVPEYISQFLGQVSRWALLIAIAAVGMKTNLGKMGSVGAMPIAMVTVQTAFLALFIFLGIFVLGGI